jgi:hypothetical protein
MEPPRDFEQILRQIIRRESNRSIKLRAKADAAATTKRKQGVPTEEIVIRFETGWQKLVRETEFDTQGNRSSPYVIRPLLFFIWV